MRRALSAAARRSLVAGLSFALAGCFQGGTTPDETPAAAVPPAVAQSAPDPVRSRIVFTALQMVGVPYRYGGESPEEGFDCSGLVQYAYRSAGVSLPRTSRGQLKASRPVALADAVAGDLLFFRSKNLSHVGIYLGEGRFVHAPATGRTVSIASFSTAYYRRNFVRAGHIPGIEQAATCARATTSAC